jgi:hypothetical protein
MRGRFAIGVAAGAAVASIALVPRASSPLLRVFPRYSPAVHHLPGRSLDAGDPIYFHVGYQRAARVDTAAIRRAGELVPNDAIYYVRTPASDPTRGDIVLAAQLFLLPAVQSKNPSAAGWILSYRSPAPTARARQVYELGPDLRLTEVR